jgi:4-carboxymuconolactone decarboxylase
MDDLFQVGQQIRRDVVGPDHVEASLKNLDEFSKPLQDIATAFCWGAVWGREGLPRKTRSLLTIVLLAALNRPDELRLHIIGAVRNGCSKTEIREALLHVSIYAGLPAAVGAFRVAREALIESEKP